MVFAPKDSALIVVCCQWYQIDGEYPEIAVNPYTLSVYSLARFDLRTGALTVLDSDFHNSKVALASDGVRFAVLTSSGELSLHQIGHRSALHTAQMPPRREWPNVYTIAFSEDGKKIVIYWYGQLLIFDAHTLDSRIYIDDSLEWGTPEMLGSTVFLSRDPLKLNPILIDPLNGKKTEIQPPVLNAEYQYMNEAPVLQSLRAVGSGIVGNGNYLIARYEVRTTGVPIEGGARAGTDSLLITPLDHSNQRWGIGVEPSTIILDGPSIKGPSLLLTDGYLLRMVHLRSHKIETVFNSRP